MTGPAGHTEFCFPSTDLNVPLGFASWNLSLHTITRDSQQNVKRDNNNRHSKRNSPFNICNFISVINLFLFFLVNSFSFRKYTISQHKVTLSTCLFSHSRSNAGKTGNQFCATFKLISRISTSGEARRLAKVSLLPVIEIYDNSDNSDLTACNFSIEYGLLNRLQANHGINGGQT